MKSPHSTLFAGTVLDGHDMTRGLVVLRDGSCPVVRVRELPARHHLEILDLFQVGREADLIQRCVEIGTPAEGGTFTWAPATDAWVDSLDDLSHQRLVALCEELNFQRAITTAERQIARGQTLSPLMQKMSQQMLEPMRRELASWTSSLTSQLSAALAEKKH
jgi:hypothetical protein